MQWPRCWGYEGRVQREIARKTGFAVMNPQPLATSTTASGANVADTNKPTVRRLARPITGVQAAADALVAKAKEIAQQASKKARPAMRRKEAITLEIRHLRTAIAANEAKISKLLIKEKEEEKQIEAAQAEGIATLNKMIDA